MAKIHFIENKIKKNRRIKRFWRIAAILLAAAVIAEHAYLIYLGILPL